MKGYIYKNKKRCETQMVSHLFLLMFIVFFDIILLPQNQQYLCMSNLRERVANIMQTRK